MKTGLAGGEVRENERERNVTETPAQLQLQTQADKHTDTPAAVV